MTGLFTAPGFFERHAGELARIERETGASFERLVPPGPDEELMDEASLARIEIAYFSGEVREAGLGRRFLGGLRFAPNLAWLHLGHAGADAPVFVELFRAGARLSNSSGSAAQSIAQSAIAGLLMLSRGFPRWGDAQRRRAWEEHGPGEIPRDLSEETLVVLGLGAIGNEIARLGRALGLRVVGVRRSALREGDHVDGLRPPSELPELLAGADWFAIACPLNDETRHLVDARLLGRLPDGARVINVARGAIVDEPALIAELKSGRLGGAYLDVFEVEPLPAESPLWDLPNVVISPHNSASSSGYGARTNALFLRNLEAYARGEPLENEIFDL
jgi:phosphoglycerate dehydrogenase-like enzyme